MATSDRPRRPQTDLHEDLGYFARARLPLQMLVFLAPLIVGYEIALALLLRVDDEVITNLAHKTLLQFFDLFGLTGTGGLLLGSVLIIIVLLLWHLLNRDPWSIHWPTIALMAVESIALALPLLAFSRIVGSSDALAAFNAGASSNGDLDQLNTASRIAISVGAGLYEELAFRMVLIAALHTLLVDLAKLPHWVGAAIAIVFAAAAFTWYHPLGDGAGGIALDRAIFFFGAGLYFGVVYVLRGFGIVVAVHAMYDIFIGLAYTPAG